jgi:hypothetical protein
MTGDLIDLAALGADGEYRTRNRLIITDTAGVPMAESSIVPRLFVHRSIDAQRKLRPLPAAEREAALTKAAVVFVSSTIAGLDFDSYVDLTCRVTGLPIAAARAVAHTVAESVTNNVEHHALRLSATVRTSHIRGHHPHPARSRQCGLLALQPHRPNRRGVQRRPRRSAPRSPRMTPRLFAAAAVLTCAAALSAQPAPAHAALLTVSSGDRIDTPNTCTIAYTYTGRNDHTYAITAGHCANGKPVCDHRSGAAGIFVESVVDSPRTGAPTTA